MIRRRRIGAIFAAALCGAVLSACVTNYPTREISYKAVDIDRPATSPKDSELLGVRISAFDPGKLPEDPNVAKGISPEIRNAEAYFIPVQIKNTMERSGHWGPVRVVPRGTHGGEVAVDGRILESDGEILKLEISVKDAAGVHWFTKEYESVIDEKIYRDAQQKSVDAFQPLYNEIANDIARHRKGIAEKDTAAIRQIAEIKFGAEFAPEAYGSYVRKSPAESAPPEQEDSLKKLIAFFQQTPGDETPKSAYAVSRLPSQQDPIVQRVQRIRAREEFLVDTLDQQYDGLARSVTAAYTQWRQSRLTEIKAIREADRLKAEQQGQAVAIGILGALAGAAIARSGGGNCIGCQTAGVAVASAAMVIAVQQAAQASQQAEAETALRKAALEEIGKAVVADVKPVVIEVEGQTVELKGSVEKKFEQWRDVLKKLREQEVGPSPAPTPTAAKTS